jgi:hypothetical protein
MAIKQWISHKSVVILNVVTGFKPALDSKVHGLEFLYGLWSLETMQKIVENNIIYVPTLDREPQGHLNITALNQSGVALGVGTDSPVEISNGNSYHHELSRMVNAGNSDAKALIYSNTKWCKCVRIIKII